MYPDYLIARMRRNVRAYHNNYSEAFILGLNDDELYANCHPIDREDIDKEMIRVVKWR